MNTGNVAEVAVFLGALAVLGFVSASAAALTGVRRGQLRRLLSADGEGLRQFEAQYGSYRSALVALRIAGVVAAISAATLLAADVSSLSWWAVALAGLGSAVLIVAAEAPARSAAAKEPERFLRSMAVPLAVLNAVFRPLTRLIPLSSEAAFSHSFAGPVSDTGPLEEARRLRRLMSSPEESTALHEDELKMIRSILALDQTTVREIMVPRPDFIALSTEATLPEVLNLLVESGRSRIPLYEGTMDTIVGVIYAKDVLNVMNSPGAFDIRRIARQPYFVPETKKVRQLLEDFREKNVHFALVVDEYGGVEGLVSINDVLQEIVGEIEGEFEAGEDAVLKISDHEAIAHGTASVDEVNEALSLDLSGEGFETIGGFVLHHLGRIPKPGERVESDGVAVEVISTVGRRVEKVRIRKVALTPGPSPFGRGEEDSKTSA